MGGGRKKAKMKILGRRGEFLELGGASFLKREKGETQEFSERKNMKGDRHRAKKGTRKSKPNRFSKEKVKNRAAPTGYQEEVS